MANIAVFIDLRRSSRETGSPTAEPTPASHEALAQARLMSSALGATVYGVIATGALAGDDIDALATTLGASGADRLIIGTDPRLDGPPLDAVHGRLLALVVEKVRPRVFLFPCGSVTAQLAPPLAADMRAYYFPGATVVADEDDGQVNLRLRRMEHNGHEARVLDVNEAERAIVATTPAGAPPWQRRQRAGGEAEVEMLPCPPDATTQIRELDSQSDDQAQLEHAVTVILARASAHDADDEKEALGALQAELPVSTAAILDERPTLPADVMCPSRLILVGVSAWPPPVTPAGDGVIAYCGPKRPPSKNVGIAANWKIDARAALADLLGALAGEPPEGSG